MEIVLVKDFADEKDITIDQWIGIISPNGVERVKVVGLIAKEGPGQTNNGAFGIVPLRTLQELFNRDGTLDQIDVLTIDENPDQRKLEALKETLQVRLGKGLSVTFPASQGKSMTQMLQNYQIGLNFMSGIALFVGAFLIYNAFAMTVIERTREFGMLRTIGMTRGQVTSQLLLEATILGVFGSILGVGLGVFLSRGMTTPDGDHPEPISAGYQLSFGPDIFQFHHRCDSHFHGGWHSCLAGRPHLPNGSITHPGKIETELVVAF